MYYGEKVCLRAYKEEEAWIKSQKSSQDGSYKFAIEDIETNKYIGGCGIQEVNWISQIIRKMRI